MKGLMFIVNTSSEPLNLDIVAAAIEGGIDIIQWRHKGSYTPSWIDYGKQLATLCRAGNIPLITNDRADICLAVGAQGVHVGQTDVPVPVVRQLLGANAIIGGTASTLEQAIQLQREGATYVSLGHVFETHSKHKPYPPIGTEILHQAAQTLSIPVFAIGGITLDNLTQLRQTGITGVAVISTIASSPNPLLTTQQLKALLC